MQFLFRRFLKTKNLRIINIAGLILLFSCFILSYAYVKKELSYESMHTKASRLVRLSLGYNGNKADGRLWGAQLKSILKDIPEIEDELNLLLINTGTISRETNKRIINNIYYSTENLLGILDIPLLDGDPKTALSTPESVIISEALAIELFGSIKVIGETLDLSGRKIPSTSLTIRGVYKNFSENTHFHTDVIVRGSEELFLEVLHYSYHYYTMQRMEKLYCKRFKML